MRLLITYKPAYKRILLREAATYSLTPESSGIDWVLFKGKRAPASPIPEFSFFNCILINPHPLTAQTVKEFSQKIADHFCRSIQGKEVKNNFPLIFLHSERENLSRRAKSIETIWHEKIPPVLRRLQRCLSRELPRPHWPSQGYFIYFTDFTNAYTADYAIFSNQQRMRMDENAPSRSYLKIEEAYGLIDCHPLPKETVVDLGAAPGGWSYSALQRGASVIAVDRANLSISNDRLIHLREDAFTYQPKKNTPVDWLFCDIIAQPDMVIDLVKRWLDKAWCKKFIVNLKIGKTDPLMIIKKIKTPKDGLGRYCSFLRICQLYHNRQEITLAGKHLKAQAR